MAEALPITAAFCPDPQRHQNAIVGNPIAADYDFIPGFPLLAVDDPEVSADVSTAS
jgi:hypothetical protein